MQLKGLNDPRAALRTLKAVNVETLATDKKPLLQKLLKQAKSMLASES